VKTRNREKLQGGEESTIILGYKNYKDCVPES